MYTVTAELTFYIPHATSLKDKRQVCRSLIDKSRRRFNATVAEVDNQDVHQSLTLGVAVVSGSAAHGRQLMNDIVSFMEKHADAELQSVNIE